MPFIEKYRRDVIDELGLDALPYGVKPGDRCYVYYKPMVLQWKANPCWTRANSIYMDMLSATDKLSLDERAAYQLAWQVFFDLYVAPYEKKQRGVNGDVE